MAPGLLLSPPCGLMAWEIEGTWAIDHLFIYWFPLRQAVFKCQVTLRVPVVEREALPRAWCGGPV